MADSSALGGTGTAERKLVTVLLADVDEAAGAWNEPDPEDVNLALGEHAARIRDQVRRFGGVVEHRVGGRTLAVFGLPRTREDDPARAVLAALAIRDALGGPAGAVRPRLVVATGRALVAGRAGPAAGGGTLDPHPPDGDRARRGGHGQEPPAGRAGRGGRGRP